MGATQDLKLQYMEGVELPFPMYRSVKIYGGSLVAVNATGYAVPGADTAGLIFEGVATHQVDNSSGQDGDKQVVLRRRGLIKCELATAITQGNVGDNVFLAGDDKVDVTANVAQKIFCGVIAGFIDTTHAWIDIEPAIRQADVASHLAAVSEAHSASAISILDAGTFTSEEEVEAALQEIYQDLITAQAFIPIPLTMLMEGDGTNTVAYLGPATTPKLDMLDGDTDSALALIWIANGVDPVIFQAPLPPDLDTSKDLVIHMRAALGSTPQDTVTLASDAYFNEGDTKVEDTSQNITLATYAEKTITIAAADIPEGAQTLTVELTPSAHANDALYVTALWIEYTRKLLSA